MFYPPSISLRLARRSEWTSHQVIHLKAFWIRRSLKFWHLQKFTIYSQTTMRNCMLSVMLLIYLENGQRKQWSTGWHVLLFTCFCWYIIKRCVSVKGAYTGWHIRWSQTPRWHQNKSSVSAWPGQDRPGQNGTFVLKSTEGSSQADVSPCTKTQLVL